MATVIIILIVTLIIFLTIYTKNGWPSNGSPTFQVASSEILGKYLVDSRKRALYFFVPDEVGTTRLEPKSLCGEGCLGVWQICHEEKILISSSLKKGDFSNLERPQDGQKQTAYKGHPLYYYINDINPGDAKGEGIGNTWFTLKIY